MLVGVQKLRLDIEDAVEIEGVAAQNLIERDLRPLGAMQLGVGIDAADAGLDLAQLGIGDQIGLVEQDHVGKGDLVLGLGRILETVLEPFGVGHRDHRVEPGLAADILVDEEGLRHRRGVGEARGLDDDGVELALAPHQPIDDADQVAAHGAADAAVVHLEHFFVGADDQLVVDADLAELVDDHGVFLAVRLGQDAVEQRGLAGAEIAGEHGDGDFFGLSLFGRLIRAVLPGKPPSDRNTRSGDIGDPTTRKNPLDLPGYLFARRPDTSGRSRTGRPPQLSSAPNAAGGCDAWAPDLIAAMTAFPILALRATRPRNPIRTAPSIDRPVHARVFGGHPGPHADGQHGWQTRPAFCCVQQAGGGGILGTAEVARAKPDGYTLMHGAAFSVTVQPLTERQPATRRIVRGDLPDLQERSGDRGAARHLQDRSPTSLQQARRSPAD